MSIDGKSVNLPKPFLVKVGLLFAMVVHVASTLLGDEVPCTWLPVIAYQGLCATTSNTLLIPTVGPIIPDQDICIARDGKAHCNSRPSQPIESAWYCLLRDHLR